MNNFSFTVSDDWNSGFIGDVIVSDLSTSLDGWTMEFDVPFEIEEIWGAEIVSRNGDRYTIKNAWWNEDVASGQSFTFGFKGKGSSAGTFSAIELNNQPFTDTTTTPEFEIPEIIEVVSETGAGSEDPGSDGSGSSAEPPTQEGNTSDNGTPTIDLGSSDLDQDQVSSPQSGTFNYGEALQKSFLFYEAQRSGSLPSDNRLDWRGDSALTDGQDVGLDLTGGYYDAGNDDKLGFTLGGAMTLLGWGVIEYEDAYRQSGQLDEALEAIKWGTDWMLKAHVTDGQGTKEYWGHVDGTSGWYPFEDVPENRVAQKIDRQNPGSDLAGESAASLAAASIAFRDVDPGYADTLLQNAIQLYDFADSYRGIYSDAIPDAGVFYRSGGYMDELVWGATWLYKATGDESYLDKAENYYDAMGFGHGWTHDWGSKSQGATVLLAQETGDQKYIKNVESWLNYWSDQSGNGISYTPGGLAWASPWASLRYSANTAFIAGVYSDTVNDANGRYADFVESQVDYILGENPKNMSYMVGFGDDFSLRPHHPSAHGVAGWENFGSLEPNRNILYGALVGGPASLDDFDYVDVRHDYIRNEVALDYNAAFTGALAWMYAKYGGDPLTDSQLDALAGVSVADAF